MAESWYSTLTHVPSLVQSREIISISFIVSIREHRRSIIITQYFLLVYILLLSPQPLTHLFIRHPIYLKDVIRNTFSITTHHSFYAIRHRHGCLLLLFQSVVRFQLEIYRLCRNFHEPVFHIPSLTIPPPKADGQYLLIVQVSKCESLTF